MVATDSVLLSRARAGDRASFDELFLRYYSRMYDVLFRLTGDPAEADDLAQETFIKLHRTLTQSATHPSLADTGREHNVAGWLYRVAVNLGYNAMRDAHRRATYEKANSSSTFADPETSAIEYDERHRVRRILAELPPQQAQLLVLRHAGLSYKELAQALDVAPTSIGTLLARAERAFEARYRAATGSEATGETDAHK